MQGFALALRDKQGGLPKLQELTLTCRDDVGTPWTYFTDSVNDVWFKLATGLGIECWAICQILGAKANLADIFVYERDILTIGSKPISTDDDESTDDDDSTDEEMQSDDNVDMPDLIESMD